MSKIRFPPPLPPNAHIGITAASSGLGPASHIARFELVEAQLRKRGFKVTEGKCLRSDRKHVSAPAQARAQEFTEFWLNPEIDLIAPPWGGELLIEILSLLDFEVLARSPAKWFLGYSDLSTLHFALTLKTRTATAHGLNLMDLVENQPGGITQKYFEYLSLSAGSSFTQKSFAQFQRNYIPYEEKLDATFNLTERVEWKRLNASTDCEFSGRLIGGCLDTIVHLVGTPYGELPKFVADFSADGTIFYFENCELTPCHVARALWQMKIAGFFDGLSGILIGRPRAADATSANALNYRDALSSALGDLKIPILFDVDIGHMPPQFLLVNGAQARVSFAGDRGEITQQLV